MTEILKDFAFPTSALIIGAIISVVAVAGNVETDKFKVKLAKTQSLILGLLGVGLICAGVVSYYFSINPTASTESATALSLANSTSTPSAILRKTSAPIAVDATKDWQSSGINVKRGDTISISVVAGKWTIARYPLPQEDHALLPSQYNNLQVWVSSAFEVGGEGYLDRYCRETIGYDCPIPSGNLGALVARLNNTGVPILIGEKKTFVASEDGTIFLRINDGNMEGIVGLSDNAGILAVEIEVK